MQPRHVSLPQALCMFFALAGLALGAGDAHGEWLN